MWRRFENGFWLFVLIGLCEVGIIFPVSYIRRGALIFGCAFLASKILQAIYRAGYKKGAKNNEG